MLQKYNQCFMDIFNIKASDLNEKFTFEDTEQWDSYAHMELITKLEETFDIMIDFEDIIHFESYENGKNILRKCGIDI